MNKEERLLMKQAYEASLRDQLDLEKQVSRMQQILNTFLFFLIRPQK